MIRPAPTTSSRRSPAPPDAPARAVPRAATFIALAVTLTLGACATWNVVDSDVSSYTQWPADRSPGRYAFERLPSQQARPDEQAALEQAARRALEKAGFSLASEVASADVVVQLGLRTTRLNPSSVDDRLLWAPAVWYGHPWRAPHGFRSAAFGWSDVPRYEREVAMLIRDRRSGQALYESRASNDGSAGATAEVLAAMFEAALKDFPSPAVNPRRVRVELVR